MNWRVGRRFSRWCQCFHHFQVEKVRARMNPARKSHQVYTRLTGLEKLVRINNCIEFLFKLQVAQLRASGGKRGKKKLLVACSASDGFQLFHCCSTSSSRVSRGLETVLPRLKFLLVRIDLWWKGGWQHHQSSILNHRSRIINHQSPPTDHQSSIINHQPSSSSSIMKHQSSIINHQSSNINHQSSIINHHQPSSIINHQSSTIIIKHHQSSSIIITHHQSSASASSSISISIIKHHQASSSIINHDHHHHLHFHLSVNNKSNQRK